MLQSIPGISALSPSKTASNPSSVRLVPDVADPIPAAVLANPIIGEFRRFDGSVAPANWLLCQGQTLKISDDRTLFAVLGSIVGGDGKTTFKLPTARGIIAVAGTFPNSPLVLQAGRHMTLAASLGEGARPVPARIPKPPSAELLAERRLSAQALRVGPTSPVPLSREISARITQSESDARSAAFTKLSGPNQSRLQGLVAATVAGTLAQYTAVRQMADALSDAEASALIDVNDTMLRTVQSSWGGSSRDQARLEAAYFVVAIAFTPEQKEALAARERS